MRIPPAQCRCAGQPPERTGSIGRFRALGAETGTTGFFGATGVILR